MIASKPRVAVVGAGVAGLTAALTLQRDGMNVVLFDRNDVPCPNTSAVAGGMLAPFSESDVLPYQYVAAGLAGIEAWKHLLGGGWETCLRINGSLVVHAGDEGARQRFAFEHAAADGGQAVDREAIRDLEPHLSPRATSAWYLPQEAHLLPGPALFRLFARFVDAGGVFRIEACEPRRLIDSFDFVIDCRGFVPDLYPDLEAVRGELIVVHSDEVTLRRPIRVISDGAPLYLVPRDNGEIAIGATSIRDGRPSEWRVTVSSASTLLSFAVHWVPALSKAHIVGLHSGTRAAYPSLLPELRTGAEGRLITANGLYRHGFLLSPVMAGCIAAALKGQSDRFDPLFSGRMNLAPAFG